ncbi:DUF4215 domain-containing protein [Candidatus Gracilibacteria bacterium]|nr:DUF4215 domain-containing protein [Candidatus Gracilibacteria bacterium]
MKKKSSRLARFLCAGIVFLSALFFLTPALSAQGVVELNNGWNDFSFSDFVKVQGSGEGGTFQDGDKVNATSWNKILFFLRSIRENLIVGCTGGEMLTGINEDGSPRCVVSGTITQQGNCDSKPANTIWNVSGTFTQTWQGGAFTPASKSAIYNATQSTEDCHFVCEGGYSWNSGTEQCEALPSCGDGTVDPGEACDDNNTSDGDGCSSSCAWETGTYSCNPKPAVGTSWNTVSQYEQTCAASNGTSCTLWSPVSDPDTDYNATPASDECRYTCASGYQWNSESSLCEEIPPDPSCGDGNIDQGESCDDGNTANGDGCASNCTWETKTFSCNAKPATGTIWNTVSNYEQTCTESNGSICTRWDPDDDLTTNYNATPSDTSCQYTCTSGYQWNTESQVCEVIPPDPACGDGTVDSGEECDDGNISNGDGCSSSCTWESRTYTCNDKPATGTIWNTVYEYQQACTASNGSSCTTWNPVSDSNTDYNATSSTESCRYKCASGYQWNTEKQLCETIPPAPACGDGHVDIGEGEECDDGNTSNGDGCASNCTWESRTYSCNPKPSTGTLWNTVSSYPQDCTASNGSSCTTWNPPSDGVTDYNTTASSTSCRYTCASNYVYTGSVCEPVLNPPGSTSGGSSPGQISVSWGSVSGADAYNVERRVRSGIASSSAPTNIFRRWLTADIIGQGEWGSWSGVASYHTGTSYTDTNVSSGSDYQYRVQAVDIDFPARNSSWSGEFPSGGISPGATTRTYSCNSPLPDHTTWNTVPSYTQSWNGSSWTPADDPFTDYNTTASSTSCRYKCDQYSYYLTGIQACTPYVCAGSTPSNASICSGDNTNLTSSVLKTVVSSCTTSTKCEYTCNQGYVKSGSSCINTRSCLVPNGTGQQTWNWGTNSWSQCQVVSCNSGYHQSGNSCISNSRTYTCPAKPSTGTVWNTVSSYAQNWDGAAWDPETDTTTNYRTWGSTDSCQFKCASNYHWDSEAGGGAGACVEDAVCGNGQLQTGESCDDGDTSSGDGCNSVCQVESGWACTSANPSVCVHWVTGSWGTCSTTCGSGTQSRSVTCKTGAGQTVTDYQCLGMIGAKPSTSQSCTSYTGCECTGTTPNNSSMCTGDNTNLTSNVTKIPVNSCTSRKCEWKCGSGRIAYQGGCAETSYYWDTGSWGCPNIEMKGPDRNLLASLVVPNNLIADVVQCPCSNYTRSVRCKRSPDGATVSDSYCPSPKPDTSWECNVPPAPTTYSWEVTGTGYYCECCVENPPPYITCDQNRGKRQVTSVVCKADGTTVTDGYCLNAVGPAPQWVSCYQDPVFSNEQCWGP